jgi:hypothetical protein
MAVCLSRRMKPARGICGRGFDLEHAEEAARTAKPCLIVWATFDGLPILNQGLNLEGDELDSALLAFDGNDDLDITQTVVARVFDRFIKPFKILGFLETGGPT